MKWKWAIPSVALAAALAVALTAVMPAQSVTPDEATLKLFPADTQGIAYVDVAGLRGASLFAEFWLGLQKNALEGGKMQRFVDRTGFRPDRDLDSLTIGKLAQGDMLVVARARMDRIRLEQFVEDEGAESETYLGRVIFAHGKEGVAFVDGFILAGSVPAMKQAIDRLAAPAPHVLQNDQIAAAIRKIEAGNQIWAVGELSQKLPVPRGIPDQARDALAAIKSGTYQMRIDENIHVTATGEFLDADRARSFGDLGRGAVAMLKLQAAKERDMITLLDGLRIEDSGTTMTVRFAASGDLIKKLHNRRLTRVE